MGSPATLTLGPQVSTVTGASSIIEDDSSQKLATYLRNLQGERGKIEAFKRELPLCMELLDAAIESTKQRVMDDECSDGSKRTQDFMPLKKRWERRSEEVVLGRPAWMGEAQLWTKHQHSSVEVDFGIDQGKGVPRLLHRQGGAFVPFNRDRQLASPPFSPPPAACVPDPASLSLSTTTSTVPTTTTAATNNGGDSEENTRVRDSSDARVSVEYAAQIRAAAAQPQRKARRCWSPELHRRFVSALQQLGGSQVATPKQIRELMKVDGLTNDEVKSHLQKYRLHTRRSSPSPSPSSHAPQLLILGWVPPECTPPAAVGAASQASTGGVCDDPSPPAAAVGLEHTPPHSLRGASPGRGESPHSSSDSYMDESDDEQEEAKSTTSSQKHQQSHSPDEKSEQQVLQSKGSTTCLPDIDSITRNRSSMGKLQTFRKAKAAA
jgi:SHAQKYF class myb-like DNA-binding protein